MKFAIYFSLFFLLAQPGAIAQPLLLPYLKDSLYGLADTNGKIIVQPQFEDVIFYHNHQVGAFKKNGLWGIIDTRGNILLPNQIKVEKPPTYETNKLVSIVTPMYDTTRSFETYYNGGDYINLELYKITDKYAGVEYYVHPRHPVSKPQRFYDVSKLRNRYGSGSSKFQTGMIKVATGTNSVNFIDTSGQLILAADVFDGRALTERFIVLTNENKEHALYDRLNRTTTAYKYSDIKVEEKGEYIVLSEKKNNSYNYYRTLLNSEGTSLHPPVLNQITFNEKFILVNDSASCSLLDRSGKKLFEMNKCTLLESYYNPDQFILLRDNQYGLVDSKGNIILEPTYDQLQMINQHYYSFRKGVSGGIMDTQPSIVWTLDSTYVLGDLTRFPELFEVKKERGNKSWYGLADKNGNLVLKPISTARLEPHHSANLVQVFNDTTSAIFSMEGKEIIPFSKSYKQINFQEQTITAQSRGIKNIYNLSGTLLKSEKQLDFGYEISNLNGASQLIDYNGKPVSDVFASIREHSDDKSGRRYFVAKKSESDHHISVINAEGKSIIPPEYMYVNQFRHSSSEPVENGSVILIHEQDYLSGTKPFRSGAMGLDGSWILQPEYQYIILINNELFAVYNPGAKTMTLYDRNGRKISEKPYIFNEYERERRLEHPRVLVTQRMTPKSGEVLYDKLSSDMRMGIIDLDGNEITPMQYTSIKRYNSPYKHTTAQGIDKFGNAFSSVIDLDGKEILRTKYEDLYISFGDSSLVTAKGSRKGIMHMTGEIIIEPTWSTIEMPLGIRQPGIYIVRDSTNAYFYFPGKPLVQVHAGENILADIFYKDDFIEVFSSGMGSERDKVYKSIFDIQGNYYGAYSGVEVKMYYPAGKGYLIITEKKGDLPYIVNIRTKKEFRA